MLHFLFRLYCKLSTHAIVAVLLLSLYADVTLIRLVRTAQSKWTLSRVATTTPLRPVESYTFIGSDYPTLLPVETSAVKMVVEESVHYSLTDSEAADDWLANAPVGDNHIRLGPDNRMFAIAMIHELHCLRGIRDALEKSMNGLHTAQQEHMHHCFNYLRQWTLCSADVTLEPGDWSKRNFSVERSSVVHTCSDWEPVYNAVRQNWRNWTMYQNKEKHRTAGTGT